MKGMVCLLLLHTDLSPVAQTGPRSQSRENIIKELNKNAVMPFLVYHLCFLPSAI